MGNSKMLPNVFIGTRITLIFEVKFGLSFTQKTIEKVLSNSSKKLHCSLLTRYKHKSMSIVETHIAVKNYSFRFSRSRGTVKQSYNIRIKLYPFIRIQSGHVIYQIKGLKKLNSIMGYTFLLELNNIFYYNKLSFPKQLFSKLTTLARGIRTILT